MGRPAAAGRPRFDIGDIVRQHRAALEEQEHLTLKQRRVLAAIELCRTAALGGHVDACRSCGHEHPAYNSCRNRHCPKCQALAQEKWIAARGDRLLPVKHFHVVFTLPGQLRPLAKARSHRVYNALLAAASATLVELGRSRLGARLGITMVLHTWTRDLRYHPHVHAIVTAGGLATDQSRWVPSNPKFLFPVKVMGALLRGKMLAALRAMHRAGDFDRLDSLEQSGAFERLMATLAHTNWIVYAKKSFRQAGHVMAYLGRYTHRVAIANSRLVSVLDTAVTFRTKNGETVTLPPVAFIRRFVQHVLPDGFHKIRHYGLYSGALARTGGQLDTSRRLLAPNEPQPGPDDTASASWVYQLRVLTGRDVTRCPVCGGRLHRVLLPSPRAPPPLWRHTP
jgi:hypothetical protein